MTSATVRADLVSALRDDLVGPGHGDADHATETLSTAPSSWYLTGFLAPTDQPLDEKEDETADEDLTSAADGPDEGEPEAPVARRPVFPSSMGVTVLVHAETKVLKVRVTYGTYAPVAMAATGDAVEGRRASSRPGPPVPRPGDSGTRPAESATRLVWVREPHDHELTLTLGETSQPPRVEPALPDGVLLRAILGDVPATELPLVPPGTRYLTLFLVNQRTAVPKPDRDKGFMFQVEVGITCAEGLVERPNLRGSRADHEIDEQIGDLQYRDAFEYAVGHGVSIAAKVMGRDGNVFCHEVTSTWVPTAEVEKVIPSTVADVELGMDALGALADGAAVAGAMGALVPAYRAWIEEQGTRAAGDLHTQTRKDTAHALLGAAKTACARIEKGLGVLAEDPRALEAFRIANLAMAAQARAPRRVKDGTAPAAPRWHPFQLAFLLMNVAAMRDPTDAEREAVDLIFFPTGGGKTEAYLGLAAFTLALRRLSHDGLGSAGVTVLMRYTLRLLTLDQLERAATLVCALELLRRRDPARLGHHRFSIGLWVGKGATPNRFGAEKDRDESTARNRVLAYAKDPKQNPSPIPVDKCPWCGEPFNQDTFQLKPSSQAPLVLRVMCTQPRCDFRWKKDHPEGIPVLAVDEEIYRELPCFVIATVDKLAALPWTGKTGLLLGRDVTHHDGNGFHGPAEMPPAARALPAPLLPPDLIIQDELHLISGPLGTMVGLYETAIDHLTTRVVGGRSIRPKIVASTATVRRAQPQIRALFGRSRVDVFPPPGPNRRTSFFSETVSAKKAAARLYVGLTAPGRSQKVLLMRAYIALLAAGQKASSADPAAADPYLTLVGYFNSLRELGGSRRIVEDEVRARLMRVASRRRVGEATSRYENRTIDFECVELTSRESTDRVKIAKERLAQGFGVKAKDRGKGRAPVDVALASNMISVGLDISRLGLMVVCGQPKTTAEYIQATSRVGRDAARPGLVVALLNVHKPRDRSHFEHFAAYHGSFYRNVEATSVTPFSPRAVDRGLAGVAVALARLGDARLTAADSAAAIAGVRPDLGFIGDVLAARAESYRKSEEGDDPIDDLKTHLRQRVESLLDSWTRVASDHHHDGEGLAYQLHEEGQSSRRPLLRMPLDPDLAECDKNERPFVANRSMRDVEGTVDVYVTTLKSSTIALEEGR